MDEPQKNIPEGELEVCKKQAEEYLNGWKRAKADYMNLERQVEQEKAQWMNMAVLPLVLELITIVEHLDQAFVHAPRHKFAYGEQVGGPANCEYIKEFEAWVQGIDHTRDDIKGLLKNMQVERMETVGKHVDLNLMEVVAKEKTESQESGIVVREVTAGYTIAGSPIKIAKVIVAE